MQEKSHTPAGKRYLSPHPTHVNSKTRTGAWAVDVVRRSSHIPPMVEPFIEPQEPSARLAIKAIADELSVFDDWMDRYQFIIELGRKLPPFPSEWMNDAHRVPGCQSQVWMESVVENGRMLLAGTSDAAIVSGLVALLLRVYSGRTAAEIGQTDPGFLSDLGLIAALSTNRGNGVASMALAIRKKAAAVSALA